MDVNALKKKKENSRTKNTDDVCKCMYVCTIVVATRKYKNKRIFVD